jgi:hypothetical protein
MLVAIVAAATPIVVNEEHSAATTCPGCGEERLHVPPFETNGTLTFNPSLNVSTLAISVRNAYGAAAITSVLFYNSCPNDCPNSTGTIANVADLTVIYQGNPLSKDNSLPAGPLASGTLEVENAVVGTTYTMNVNATFADKYVDSVTISITAEA